MSLRYSRICHQHRGLLGYSRFDLEKLLVVVLLLPTSSFFVTLILGVGNWGVALIISSPAWEFFLSISFS